MKKRKIYTNTVPEELIVTDRYTYVTTAVTKVTHEEENMTTTHYECEQEIYGNEEYIMKISEQLKEIKKTAEKTKQDTDMLKEEVADRELENRVADLEMAMLEVAYEDGNVYSQDDN